MEVIKSKSGYLAALRVTESRILSGAVSEINKNFIRSNSREYVTVKTLDGEKIARVGNWIVEVDKKTYVVLTDNEFKSLFDKF